MDYTPILTGEEKAWLTEHGAIRMGFLTSDSGVSTFDPATGKLTGAITDYILFAADCLGNQELEFHLVGYDSKEAELDALKSGEIDMIFHCDQKPQSGGRVSHCPYQHNVDLQPDGGHEQTVL